MALVEKSIAEFTKKWRYLSPKLAIKVDYKKQAVLLSSIAVKYVIHVHLSYKNLAKKFKIHRLLFLKICLRILFSI